MQNPYMEMLDIIKAISSQMPDQIQYYSDKESQTNKYAACYYTLAYEIFKGLELCKEAVCIDAYSQIGMLLRQLFEQISTLKLISADCKALLKYVEFANARLDYIKKNDGSTLLKLKESCKLSNKKKGRDEVFATYGWIEECGATEISYDELLKLANLKDFVAWRKFYNHYVHGHITLQSYVIEYRDYIIDYFIYFMAIIMDELICDFHNHTNFNFKFSEKCNYDMFIAIYTDLQIQQRIEDDELAKQHPEWFTK